MSLLLEALKRAEEDSRRRRWIADSMPAPLDGIPEDPFVPPVARASAPAALREEEPQKPAEAEDDGMPDLYFPELTLVPASDAAPEEPQVDMTAEAVAPVPTADAPLSARGGDEPPARSAPAAPAHHPTSFPTSSSTSFPAMPPAPPPVMPARTARQSRAAAQAMTARPASGTTGVRRRTSRRTVVLAALALLLLLPLGFLFLWGDALTGPAPVAARAPLPVAAPAVAPQPDIQPVQDMAVQASATQVAAAASPVSAEATPGAPSATPSATPAATPFTTPPVTAAAVSAPPAVQAPAPAPDAKPVRTARRSAPQASVAAPRAATAAPANRRSDTPAARVPAASQASSQASNQTATLSRISSMLASAYASFQAGNMAAAESAYRDAVKVDPGQRDAWLGMAVVAHATGHRADAIEAYKQVLRLDPQNGTALSGLGSLERSRDEPAQESRLRGLLAESPQSAELNHALGLVMAGESRWSEAQPLFFKAHALSPQEPQFAFNLAVALDRLRKPDLARQYYRDALALAEGRRAGFDVAAARARLNALANPPAAQPVGTPAEPAAARAQ